MKKIAPYIFILITLIGLFSPRVKANAWASGDCWYHGQIVTNAGGLGNLAIDNESKCKAYGDGTGIWQPAGTPPPTPKDDRSEFRKQLEDHTCFGSNPFSIGCLVRDAYYIFYVVPAFLLGLVGYLFNILIHVSLSSTLFRSPFVSVAWKVVLGISNIFFLLILLYISIKIILDLGKSEAKKMISLVVFVAIIINFSMFFTQIVIDSSNIVASVFYNKLQVCVKKNPTDVCTYSGVGGEKDVSRALVSSFDPTSALTWQNFFKEAKTVRDASGNAVGEEIPNGTYMALILISGSIMLFACYALFMSGFSFLGRLIELWKSLVFSPFAFMSATVPKLSKIEYLGWESWLKNLLSAAFMGPIFMFFLYFIFLLIQSNVFSEITSNNVTGASVLTGEGQISIIKKLIGIVIPALLICVLLKQATEFAKKGSGAAGAMITKFAGVVGGLAAGAALGVATGGAALAARTAIGGGGGYAANKLAEKTNAFAARHEWAGKIGANKLASGLTSVGALAQKSSFDLRGVKIAGKSLGSVTGLSLGDAQKGGIAQARKEKVEKRMKRAEMLKVREDEGIKQKLNNSEIDLQVMLNKVAKDFGIIDRELEGLRKAKADTATGSAEERAIAIKIKDLNDAKKAVKQGKRADYMIDGVMRSIDRVEVASGANKGKTMKEMASEIIPDQKEEIETENRRRKIAYANRQDNWRHWGAASKTAKHKIIMGEKLSESAAKA